MQESKTGQNSCSTRKEKNEQMKKELENKQAQMGEDQKLLNKQLEELENISTAGSMNVVQSLSNRVLELTRSLAEAQSDQGMLAQNAAQLKEQLNNSKSENTELHQRYNKLKQQRDTLHEQSRALKNRINELELEKVRMVNTEEKLIQQVEQWEQEHANSNTELENLLHNL
eukprot:UN26747